MDAQSIQWFFVNRNVLWTMLRARRWRYNPKRCKTRRDKVESKRQRRIDEINNTDWREYVKAQKVYWAMIS